MNNEDGGGASRSTDHAAGSSAATDVSLREHLTAMIGYERSTTRLMVGFAAVSGAFAWSQIQRRLEILNHENARVATIASQTVSSDTYDSDKARTDDERDKLDTWRSSVDEKFTRSVTRDDLSRENKGDRQVWTGNSIGFILMLVAIAGLVGHFIH